MVFNSAAFASCSISRKGFENGLNTERAQYLLDRFEARAHAAHAVAIISVPVATSAPRQSQSKLTQPRRSTPSPTYS